MVDKLRPFAGQSGTVRQARGWYVQHAGGQYAYRELWHGVRLTCACLCACMSTEEALCMSTEEGTAVLPPRAGGK